MPPSPKISFSEQLGGKLMGQPAFKIVHYYYLLSSTAANQNAPLRSLNLCYNGSFFLSAQRQVKDYSTAEELITKYCVKNSINVTSVMICKFQSCLCACNSSSNINHHHQGFTGELG